MAAHYLRTLALFADFDGRASRAEWWGFVAVHLALTLALLTASAVLAEALDVGWVAGGVPVSLYLVATFFPTVSGAARRLHDVGRSSLWLAVAVVPPLAVLLAVWLAMPGEPAPNAWGQPTDGRRND